MAEEQGQGTEVNPSEEEESPPDPPAEATTASVENGEKEGDPLVFDEDVGIEVSDDTTDLPTDTSAKVEEAVKDENPAECLSENGEKLVIVFGKDTKVEDNAERDTKINDDIKKDNDLGNSYDQRTKVEDEEKVEGNKVEPDEKVEIPKTLAPSLVQLSTQNLTPATPQLPTPTRTLTPIGAVPAAQIRVQTPTGIRIPTPTCIPTPTSNLSCTNIVIDPDDEQKKC